MKLTILRALFLLVMCSFYSCMQSQNEFESWAKISTNSPSMHGENAMVYDTYNKKVINYGGRTGFPDFNNVNETWVFDYTIKQWKNMNPKTSPPWRSSHAMTYDTSRHVSLLFGANDFTKAFNDLWTYDYNLNTWTELKTKNPPEARQMHGLVYIPDRDIVLLFGGRRSNGGSDFTDTWELDCKTMTWTKLHPKVSPTVSDHINIVYDELAKKVILYAHSKTWTYDFEDKNWSKVNLPNSPDGGHCNMIYSDYLKKSILFGDSEKLRGMQTWSFDYNNQEWNNITPRRFPTISYYTHNLIEHASMVYLNDEKVIIHYGGCCSDQTLELRLNK